MLVPVGKHTGRKRDTSEREKSRIAREKRKADYYRRNPHKKWGE
jgi:hypothetical protein